jgi:hypothetical protein
MLKFQKWTFPYWAIYQRLYSGNQKERSNTGMRKRTEKPHWNCMTNPFIRKHHSSLQCPKLQDCSNGHAVLLLSMYALCSKLL